MVAAFTRLEVTVEGDVVEGLAKDRCTLFADVDYLYPRRRRHMTRYDAGVEHDRYVYVYEMPLMLMDSVRVRLAAWDAQRTRFLAGHTRFVRMDVFNVDAFGAPSGERRAVWERNPDHNVEAIDLLEIRLD